MKFGKNNFWKFALGFILIVVILVYSTNATTKANNTITVITAILGFFIIVYQLMRDHKIKKAEFIYSLNNTFNSDPDITDIYMKLKKSRYENVEFTIEDGMRMGDYVMFFMIMNYLIDEGLVNIKMIDAIFSNKFFLFCNNEYVYKYQLSQKDINYSLLKLYERWYNFRIKRKKKIHYIDKFNTAKKKDLFEMDKKGYIKLID